MNEKGSQMKEKDNTIAVIFGASKFPLLKDMLGNQAFLASASAFKDYLISENGMALGEANVLNLFDDKRNVIEQDDVFTEFLTFHKNANNLIVLYIGHGGFLPNRDYYLALYSTKGRKEYNTGLGIDDLAQSIIEYFPNKKVFLVLDCCFAGEAVREFQSLELSTLVENSTFDAFAESGTSLLCASSKDEPAIGTSVSDLTMFSDAIISVLKKGISGKGKYLSLNDVGESSKEFVKKKYGIRAVLPEVHSPKQKGVNVAALSLFPNPAFRESMSEAKRLYEKLISKSDGRRISQSLSRLRDQLESEIPKHTLKETLLLTTWNLKDFAVGKNERRTEESYLYIAEIISHFDIIAIQEVGLDSGALDKVRAFSDRSLDVVFRRNL